MNSLLRPSLAVALLSSVALALSASAAPAGPTVIEDLSGDANLLNTQILNVPAAGNGQAGPGSQAGFDIQSVTFSNTYTKGKKPTCTGFTMEMKLGAAPAADGRFRLSGDTPTNTAFFIIEYDSGQNTSEIRYGGAGQDEVHTLATPAKVVGTTLVFTVTAKDMKAIGEKPGQEISAMQATTTASVEGMLFFPIFDKAPGGDKTFKMCG